METLEATPVRVRPRPQIQSQPDEVPTAAPTPAREVVFSFFRYRTSHALSAFILMGFQGLVRGRAGNRRNAMPAGMIRLMGCGGADGFSIVPDFTRYCILSALERPAERDRLQQTRLYRMVARPSIEQLHFVLEPASGHGTWDGEVPFQYSNQRVGSRPFAVLTHATVHRSRARAFWKSVPDVRQNLRDVSGCAYHIGFGEHPFLTLATFSIWQDLPSMQQFAYRHTAHHRTSKAARSESWLSESLFVRFAIKRIEGDLVPHPGLRRLAAAGPIQTGAPDLC